MCVTLSICFQSWPAWFWQRKELNPAEQLACAAAWGTGEWGGASSGHADSYLCLRGMQGVCASPEQKCHVEMHIWLKCAPQHAHGSPQPQGPQCVRWGWTALPWEGWRGRGLGEGRCGQGGSAWGGVCCRTCRTKHKGGWDGCSAEPCSPAPPGLLVPE